MNHKTNRQGGLKAVTTKAYNFMCGNEVCANKEECTSDNINSELKASIVHRERTVSCGSLRKVKFCSQ